MIIDLIDKSRRTRIQGEKYANEIREKRGCEPSGSEPMGCSIHGGGGWKEEERRMRGERGNGRRGRWSMLMTFGIKTSGSLDRCTRPVALINGGHQLLITLVIVTRSEIVRSPLLYFTTVCDDIRAALITANHRCCWSFGEPINDPLVIMLREEWGAACSFHHSKIVIGEGFNRIFLLRW